MWALQILTSGAVRHKRGVLRQAQGEGGAEARNGEWAIFIGERIVGMIYHLVRRQEWEGRSLPGEFSAPSLAEEGFNHCSKDEEQLLRVARRLYSGEEDLVALEIDEGLLRRHGRKFDVEVQNVTDRIGTIAIAGPQSRAILEEVSGCGLSNTECGWMSARWINLAGVQCVLLRASYSGELGWELHAPSSDMRSVFEMLLEAGESRGLGCFGAYALDSMRLEKGYPAWGVDLTTERTPWESGLDNFVKCEGRSFRGKEALVAQRKELRWTMRLLEIQSPEINPFHSHAVYGGGKPVGLVTSGGFGHRTGKRLALAYLKTEALASSLEVDILGQRHHSEILERPPFDPDNIRVSS